MATGGQQTRVWSRDQVKQTPVQILSGSPPRDNMGYQMREEYGLPLSDPAYEAVQGIQAEYSQAAEDYKKTASTELEKAIADAKAKAAGNIPAWSNPETAVIYAGGDGATPQKYIVPKAGVNDILSSMTSNGYYHSVQHSDGTYGLAFGEYGREGHEAMNTMVADYNKELAHQRQMYDQQVNRARATTSNTLAVAEKSGWDQINQRYEYLSSIFGEEVGALAQDWRNKRAASSQAAQTLAAGGVLKLKAPRVV